MSPLLDLMRRLIVLGMAIVLTGCATTHDSRAVLAASAEQEVLQQLAGFRFVGRTSVRGGTADFVAPSLVWRQQGGASDVQIAGPLGGGRLELHYSPTELRVATSRGDEATGTRAEQFIVEQLGFLPPFEALRYWVLGLAAPGSPSSDVSFDSTGRIARMVQLGWTLEFTRWTVVSLPAGGVRVPQRLVATDGQLKLTVIVDRWTLGAGK
jgi:outer membrane lipoprotein LolB